MGPWKFTQSVPTQVKSLAPVEEEKEARAQAEAAMEEAGEELDPGSPSPPAILIATEPTELIVTNGEPAYKPVGPVGNDLLYIENSESDVLMEIATQRHFVLLSGRWFASEGLQGPWSFVAANELPAAFADIPEDSDISHVRVWVSGTEEAREAVLDASIPQTAAVSRSATIQVTYDGNPRFENIEGTSLQHATNTAEQVIKDGNSYYCAKDGVWYVADQAYGPWAVATAIPEAVRTIPPSSPVYNTKYIYIYDTTPDVVYVGYLPRIHAQLRKSRCDRLRHRVVLQPVVGNDVLPARHHLRLPRPLESLVGVELRGQLEQRSVHVRDRLRWMGWMASRRLVGSSGLPALSSGLRSRMASRLPLRRPRRVCGGTARQPIPLAESLPAQQRPAGNTGDASGQPRHADA